MIKLDRLEALKSMNVYDWMAMSAIEQNKLFRNCILDIYDAMQQKEEGP